MTLPCSRNLTQQPAFGGDDIAFCAFGLWTKTRHLRWVTLSEQKWVILAEHRGIFCHKSERKSSITSWTTHLGSGIQSSALMLPAPRLFDALSFLQVGQSTR